MSDPAASPSEPVRAVRRANTSPAGEPFVWLTALGVTVGVAMVVGLLGVIIANGVGVFWPRRVVEVAYVDGGKPARLLGVVALEREKRAIGASGTETQYYVANREYRGMAFVFVDDAAVSERSYPRDVVRIEREKDGEVIGMPVELRRLGEAPLAANDPRFPAALDHAVAAADERRGAIATLLAEKGAIDARIQQGRLRGGDDGERARLEERSIALRERAAELRKREAQEVLVLDLIGGDERRIRADAIVDWYFPNRLGPMERVGHFLGAMWAFVSGTPRESNTEGGVFPAIFGTLVMTVMMSLFVVPFGVLAAIYLREYAAQGPFVRAVRIAINNLAGVPSIVFGAFGFGFFVYVLGGRIDELFYADRLPTSTYGNGAIIWAALTLALMTLPVVIVATEEAIAAVPRGAREGSLACGASKWQTIAKIVLPASVPGILTGAILAMARGAGEVAPLILVGVVKLAPSLPLSASYDPGDVIPGVHTSAKFMHLGFHIFDLGFQSPDSDAARPMVFATTLLLIVLVLVLNLSAILLRDRLRRRFAVSAF
ncbi:MAG TPA: phosphate ABC transporter permease PstA [Planctomycetota bacterium]|nr:phosphate ABC transporter permease PstA [Planctomycetota bacterium]